MTAVADAHGQIGRYQRYAIPKRALDLILILLSLPLVLPVLLLCALAIRLDSPGPVLYQQKRTGQHGRTFRMYKFRTMVRNAEQLKAELAHLSILPPPDFKIINDPRITRVGRILRKTSLDELPQLIHVPRGEMSLVGPRPTDFHIDSYDLWHMERLEVPPGITGPWQVRGRNTTTFDERLRLDVQYIDNISLFLDLRILVETVGAVLNGTGE
jgi:lipopolysaccharide/colanic/teichoic acid biosynthesis glycosyltransferase